VMTPHWEDYRIARGEIDKPDIDSDRRGFALAFYRVYFQERGNNISLGSISSVPTHPGLSSGLKRLLIAGLGDAPRPSMDSWLEEIDAFTESDPNSLKVGLVTGEVPVTPAPKPFSNSVSGTGTTPQSGLPPTKPPAGTSAAAPKSEAVSGASVAIAVLSLVLIFLLAAVLTVYLANR